MGQFDIACCIVLFIASIICVPLLLLVMLPVVFEYFCGNSMPVRKIIEDGSFVLFIGSISLCAILLALGSYLDGVI
jgi:hypothetical protein